MLDINDPVARDIARARIQLILQHPFFGQMATRLKIILTDNDKSADWCNTAATDGRRLYMNRSFVQKLTFDELLFVMAHEVLHCVYDHLGRRMGRDPDYYNMAADYVINYTLVKNKIGVMPPVGLYDERYTDEETSEQIYEKLMKNKVTIKMPLDQHLDGNGGVSGDSSGGKEVEITINGDGNGPPVLTQAELDEIRNEVKANVIQAAKSAMAQENAGCIPAGVRRLIKDLEEPKMDWRSMLDCHLRSMLKDDYTFQRMSRRELGVFLPPAQSEMETAEADISIDCSGSMSEEMLKDILSEVKGIMQTFPDFKLRVWSFDTKVYNMKEFSPINIDEIHEYELMGGGGTDFVCNWDFMKRNEIEPMRFVMFTDGYPCGSWGDANYCDTLFVIHGNDSIEAPFGQTAYYEAPRKRR